MAELAGYNGGWSAYGSSAQYAGNYGSRYTAIARAEAPERVEAVTFTLRANGFRPSGGQPVLRWALCVSDENRGSYIAPGEVTDEHQLCAGTVTFTSATQTLTIPCTHVGMVYLILWSYSTATAYRVTLLSAAEEWTVRGTFRLVLEAAPGTTLSASHEGEAEAGAYVTVTANALPGYRLTGIFANDTAISEGFTLESDTTVRTRAALRAYPVGQYRCRVYIGTAPYAPYIGSKTNTPTAL